MVSQVDSWEDEEEALQTAGRPGRRVLFAFGLLGFPGGLRGRPPEGHRGPQANWEALRCAGKANVVRPPRIPGTAGNLLQTHLPTPFLTCVESAHSFSKFHHAPKPSRTSVRVLSRFVETNHYFAVPKHLLYNLPTPYQQCCFETSPHNPNHAC